MDMEFHDRLMGTLRAIMPVLQEPGVLVVGSEIPNLLQIGPPLLISHDVHVGVPVSVHAAGVWFRLRRILAHAGAAYSIEENEARRPIEEGCRAESVATEPPKLFVLVPRERTAELLS